MNKPKVAFGSGPYCRALLLLSLWQCQASGRFADGYSGTADVPTQVQTVILRPAALQQFRPLTQPAVQSQGLRSESIKQATTTGVTLRLVDGGPSADLSFIRRASVFVEAQGQAKILLAQIEQKNLPIALGVASVDLKIETSDVLLWVRQQAISVVIELEVDAIDAARTIDCLWETEIVYKLINSLCAF